MAGGHADARQYPLGMLYDEAALVEERENGRIATESILIQLAAAGVMSKPARSAFTKRVKNLNVETKLRPGLYDAAKMEKLDGPPRR